MSSYISSEYQTNPSEFEILEDMDKAEGALNELDGRLDNLNAKIDVLLEEQTPKFEDEIKPTEEEKTEEKQSEEKSDEEN
ncbi:6122_t:CDS:2 [Funneliformis geosporum]|uniref:19181_t:CDS:1 n=1 Tax=Funneliformis geosporum TaxID=1117311 RepID=A0A9W4WSN1_9GLOM|nr:6122_t:CDS:2 [Funneliformis geosporum]CAI2169265.1 19181_t:CDS:2 [Funneliformis geosporum]